MFMQDDLIAKVRKHDKDALDELFSRHMQRAYAIAFNLCSGDREQAKDLTQDALLKAVRTIGQFRGEASFSTWLYRIIYTTYLDSRKQLSRWTDVFSPWRWAKQKGEPDKEILEEPPDSDVKKNPLNVLQGKQLDGDLQKALQELPDKQRIVFQFKVLNDMSIKEIAGVMNSAEGTVKSHLFRATQHLQETLSDWTQEGCEK
jgi:RNA polymerase sigma-70 factor (ECF subfamily)